MTKTEAARGRSILGMTYLRRCSNTTITDVAERLGKVCQKQLTITSYDVIWDSPHITYSGGIPPPPATHIRLEGGYERFLVAPTDYWEGRSKVVSPYGELRAATCAPFDIIWNDIVLTSYGRSQSA